MDIKAALILHGIDVDLVYRCLKTYMPPDIQFDKYTIIDPQDREWRKGLMGKSYSDILYEEDQKKLWNFHQLLPAFLVMYKNYRKGKDLLYNFINQVGEIPGFRYYESKLEMYKNWIEKKLRTFNLNQYNFIGLNCTDRSIFNFLITIFYIKSNHPDIKIVVGGPWFDVNAQIQKLLIRDTKMVDAYIYGDGELSFPKWLASGGVHSFMDHQIENLNKLPFSETSRQKVMWSNQEAAFIYSTRGCAYRCTFCQQGLDKLRVVSAERVAENIKRITKEGLTSYFFCDNVTGYSTKRIKDIYIELEKRNLIGLIDIPFMYILPSIAADEECIILLKKMKAHVHTGLESFSSRILKLMGKPNDVELNIKVGEVFKKHSMSGDYGKILAFPSETWEEFTTSKNMFLKYATKSDSRVMGLFVLYPKTDIYKNPEKYNISFYYFPDRIANIYPDLGDYIKKIPMGYIDHSDPDSSLYNRKSKQIYLLNKIRREHGLL